MNESLHPAMREIGARADQLLEKFRVERPKFGTVAMGSSWYSSFIVAEALQELLSELRRGASIEHADRIAKAHARRIIANWNARPQQSACINHKSELAFWDGHADGTIEWAVRVLREKQK